MNSLQAVSAVNKKESSRSKVLIASIVLIIFLLSVRDIGGFAVNKYLFLLITAVTVFALPIDNVMYFIAFAMPLYVGLPGNYMTLIFLVRFLFDYKKLRIKGTAFIFCVLAGSCALIHSFITNHMAISELMFFPGMVLVMFMFSVDVKIDKSKLILSYAVGVAALGLIMLIHTLQFCDLGDLLTSANRLGSILKKQKIEMAVNVDPNYYGLFSIALISLGAKNLSDNFGKSTNKISNALLISLMGISVTIGLIGLSRAFFLVVIAWLLLYLLSVKNMKAFFISVSVILIVAVLVINFMPNVLDALNDRLSDSTMETGNGRTELVAEFHEAWSAKLSTMLFGVGIFDCNIHCMPLQILYGGGLVFGILFVLYMITLLKNKNLNKNGGILQKYLPLTVTLIMSCSVPALALINIMYPVTFVGLCMNQEE